MRRFETFIGKDTKKQELAKLEEDMEEFNLRYQTVLSSTEETILFKPVKAHKIKPKNFLGVFQKQWRYLMFTNHKLYTLDPTIYEEGNIDREKLIVNQIDIQFLSHIIFFPQFPFNCYQCLDVEKIKESNPNIIEEFKNREVEIILGFSSQSIYDNGDHFNEHDIALVSNMYGLLQLIHACNMVYIFEDQQRYVADYHRKQKRKAAGQQNAYQKRTSMDMTRWSSGFQLQYFPVYKVENFESSIQGTPQKKSSTHELKQFYRSKDSRAEIKISDQHSCLEKVETRYWLELLWTLEPKHLPAIVKVMRKEELEKQENELHLQRMQEAIKTSSQVSAASSGSAVGTMIQHDFHEAATSSRVHRFQKKKVKVPIFQLDHIPQYKRFISAHPCLKREFEHYIYKLYKPLILQDYLQVPFRNGEYHFVGTKISKMLDLNEDPEGVYNLVHEKSKLFEDRLVNVFPQESQPKIFLRKMDIQPSHHHQSSSHAPQYGGNGDVGHKIYFGFMIPVSKRVIPIDPKHLEGLVKFKNGVNLFQQFCDFMRRIHSHGFKFGYLDFQNLYFILDKLDSAFACKFDEKSPLTSARGVVLKKSISSSESIAKAIKNARLSKLESGRKSSSENVPSRGPSPGLKSHQRNMSEQFLDQTKRRKHYVEFLFIEKSLHNLTIEDHESQRPRPLSQATLNDQEEYVQNHLYHDEEGHSDYEEVQKLLSLMPDQMKAKELVEESKRILEEDPDLEDGSMSYRPPNKPPTKTVQETVPKAKNSGSLDEFNQTLELRRFFYGHHGSFRRMSGAEQVPASFDNRAGREDASKSTVSSQVKKKDLKKLKEKMARFSSDVYSLKLFVQTIRQYCMYQSQQKTYGEKYKFLDDYEHMLRVEFQIRIFEKIYEFENHPVFTDPGYIPEEEDVDQVITEEPVETSSSDDSPIHEESPRRSPPVPLSFETKLFIKLLKECDQICLDFIFMFENCQYWSNIIAYHESKKPQETPSPEKVTKEAGDIDKMNVSTFTDKKMEKMNVSQVEDVPSDHNDQPKIDLIKGSKLKIKTRKKKNLADCKMDFSTVDGTPLEDEPLISLSPTKPKDNTNDGSAEKRADLTQQVTANPFNDPFAPHLSQIDKNSPQEFGPLCDGAPQVQMISDFLNESLTEEQLEKFKATQSIIFNDMQKQFNQSMISGVSDGDQSFLRQLRANSIAQLQQHLQYRMSITNPVTSPEDQTLSLNDSQISGINPQASSQMRMLHTLNIEEELKQQSPGLKLQVQTSSLNDQQSTLNSSQMQAQMSVLSAEPQPQGTQQYRGTVDDTSTSKVKNPQDSIWLADTSKDTTKNAQ